MTQEIMKSLYNWPFLKVSKVEERFAVTESHKDESGQTVETRESRGWFVELEGVRLSFHVGSEKPLTEVGDNALLSLQTWKEQPS